MGALQYCQSTIAIESRCLYPILPLLYGPLHYIALLGTHNYAPRLLFFSILCRPLLPRHFFSLRFPSVPFPAVDCCTATANLYSSMRYATLQYLHACALLYCLSSTLRNNASQCLALLYCQPSPLLYPALLCAALLGHALLPLPYSTILTLRCCARHVNTANAVRYYSLHYLTLPCPALLAYTASSLPYVALLY